MADEKKDDISIKNLVKRYNDPMPLFWKKVYRAMMTLGVTGTAIIASQALPNVHLPFFLINGAGYLIAIGAVGTALTHFTTTNPQDSDKKD